MCKLTERYISDRNFPDKAIDALDEAGSRVHISNIIVPKSIEELEAKIEDTKNEKLAAVKSQNFELAQVSAIRSVSIYCNGGCES